MIELIRERLAAPQEAKLRAWLSKPEADILRKVLSAGCQFAQAEALQKALHATAGDVSDLVSRAEMQTAAEFHTTLIIFDSIARQSATDPFHIARLKTATDNANTTNEATD